jgi:hypothetical protein
VAKIRIFNIKSYIAGMKFKFWFALIAAIACLIMFLSLTFIPSMKNLNQTDFFKGFSLGVGPVLFLSSIYYFRQYQKEQKLSGRV